VETRHKILVVDDSQTTFQMLSDLLTAEGFAVVPARDGTEGARIAATGEVDLVLLDVELPGHDGLQTLRMIRSDADPRYLPVLMMSVRADREKRLAALKLGADDFLAKPWDAEELLARVRRCLSIGERMGELKRDIAELQRLSTTDGLTQVHNHRFFQERLRDEFRRAQRYDDPLALVVLDIDHFKEVNDRFGHLEGDRVLQQVAGCLRKSVRDTDLLARYGGEEFAVLLPKTHLAGALTVAERIWKDLEALRAGPDGAVRITASLGVSGYPNRSVISAEQLFRTADDALYRAKREGRNKICLYQQATLFSGPTAQAG
jgi:diguanylate cyclase (GGDEF)-like protein